MSKNLLGLFFLFTTVSCVNYQLTPDVVSRSDAQKQQYVVLGTIKDITTVTIILALKRSVHSSHLIQNSHQFFLIFIRLFHVIEH